MHGAQRCGISAYINELLSNEGEAGKRRNDRDITRTDSVSSMLPSPDVIRAAVRTTFIQQATINSRSSSRYSFTQVGQPMTHCCPVPSYIALEGVEARPGRRILFQMDSLPLFSYEWRFPFPQFEDKSEKMLIGCSVRRKVDGTIEVVSVAYGTLCQRLPRDNGLGVTMDCALPSNIYTRW